MSRRIPVAGQAAHGAMKLCAKCGGENLEDGVGRPDTQTLLRQQARRYNDLRVAYESLCRRLAKGHSHGGRRVAHGTRSGAEKIRLSSAHRSRHRGGQTQVPGVRPETT